MFLKFVLLVFQDAAQRSRFKRIEGTNRLKDEHDQLRIMFQEAKSELGTYAKSYLSFYLVTKSFCSIQYLLICSTYVLTLNRTGQFFIP